jgi:thiol-disulfide isomerase/thioredoxin
MIRRLVFVAAISVAAVVPLGGTTPVFAREAPAECASAVWLEPLAALQETDDTAVREITEPAPAWMTTELTDACSGETFALTDFVGKTVYIEAMATWCPPCRDQLTRVKEATTQLPEEDREEIVVVALSSEVDLPPETLAEYAASNDFPFIFAVMPAEMLQAMADDLGQAIAIPPATPHLIVAPEGTVGEIRTGSESPEDLLALFTQTQQAATP